MNTEKVKSGGELTPEAYLKAAAIIATCRDERLPSVIELLRQCGFSIVEIQNMAKEKRKAADIINLAINDYGMGTREIGSLTGLNPTQIQRIRTGKSIPDSQRTEIIINAIKSAVPNIVLPEE